MIGVQRHQHHPTVWKQHTTGVLVAAHSREVILAFTPGVRARVVQAHVVGVQRHQHHPTVWKQHTTDIQVKARCRDVVLAFTPGIRAWVVQAHVKCTVRHQHHPTVRKQHTPGVLGIVYSRKAVLAFTPRVRARVVQAHVIGGIRHQHHPTVRKQHTTFVRCFAPCVLAQIVQANATCHRRYRHDPTVRKRRTTYVLGADHWRPDVVLALGPRVYCRREPVKDCHGLHAVPAWVRKAHGARHRARPCSGTEVDCPVPYRHGARFRWFHTARCSGWHEPRGALAACARKVRSVLVSNGASGGGGAHEKVERRK